MARDDNAGSGTVLLAFLVGAVAGAAAALLYAPAAGSDTREMLAEKAREAREKANVLAEKSKQAIDEGRETLTSAIERGKEAFQQARTRETV